METPVKEQDRIKPKYPLFSVVGVEIEYMIVNSNTLNISPLSDVPLKMEPLYISNEITWSNEISAHVIELKLTNPASSLKGVDALFFENIKKIQKDLEPHGCTLMPGAMHPWMDPKFETKLWPHQGKEIYESFHKTFDCFRHGWANLQSIHLNLPFSNEAEFRKLHSSLRILLPIIPALAASSPFADGRLTGFLDYRLKVYSENSAKMPSITGLVIPDVIKTEEELKKTVYDVIEAELKPFNFEGVLEPIWVNSRGILPRFDRGSVEVRVIDSQESPLADMAVSEAIFLTANALCFEKWQGLAQLESISTKDLVSIFKSCLKNGDNAMIDDMPFLSCFGIKKPVLANEIWQKLYDDVIGHNSHYAETIQDIISKGPLAKRLIKAVRQTRDLKSVYQELINALNKNQLF